MLKACGAAKKIDTTPSGKREKSSVSNLVLSLGSCCGKSDQANLSIVAGVCTWGVCLYMCGCVCICVCVCACVRVCVFTLFLFSRWLLVEGSHSTEVRNRSMDWVLLS